MAGALHGVLASLKAAAGAATDAFFRYVSLLLNTNATNGAQNNTFLDSSTNNFSITRNGNTTQGNFSPFSQTGWSNYFDGNGDFLTAPDNAALNMGTSDFTLEAWIYLTATPGVASPGGAMIINKDGQNAVSWAQYHLAVTSGLKAVFAASAVPNATAAPTAVITGATTLALNTWYHVAVTRIGANATLWVNGVSDGTTASVPANLTNGARPLYSGYENGQAATYYFPGYISNARVVKGTAVYTSSFTPPTSPLTAITNTSLLTCQSNRFIDNSSNAFAITRNGDVRVEAFSPFNPSTTYSTANVGGSGYFDGTGDYLSIANNAAFQVGTGDFCLEGWFYTNSTTVQSLFGTVYTGATNYILVGINRTAAGVNTVGFVSGSLNDTTANITTTTAVFSLGCWNHVAFCRSGTTLSLFVNGSRVATTTSSASSVPTTAFEIGDNTGLGRPVNGFVSSVRFIKGSSPYDAALTTLTVPTSPLTAITNTSLLLNFTNAGIYDSASGNDLETVGNAQASTTQAKWGTTSMAFDGTGDWLVAQRNQTLNFGTGSFTIEGWINVASIDATYRCIFSFGAPVQIYARSGTIEVYFNDSDDTVSYIVNGQTGPASSITTNTWAHFAVVRNGTTFTTYVNGVGGTAATGVSASVFFSATAPLIGAGPGGILPFTGYIDDLRITKGVARYTGNFTPPTAAFPLN